MGAIEHLTIKLSATAAQRLRARIASGNYEDASAVVEEALASLDIDEPIDSLLPTLDQAEVEHWLRTDVVRIYDEMKRDPSRAVPLETAVARFRAERAARGE